MRRVRCQLLTDDPEFGPFRAPWPTYVLVEVDYDRMLCVVDVPDNDVPATDRDHPLLDGRPNLVIPARARVPAIEARLAAHLDTRYPQHQGRFRPRPE